MNDTREATLNSAFLRALTPFVLKATSVTENQGIWSLFVPELEKREHLPFRGAWRFLSWLTGTHPLRYSDDQNCGHLKFEQAMAKTLPLSEVKTRLPELVAGVDEREEEVVVTKNGRPAAVLVNVHEYARLKETLDVLSDPDLLQQVAESRAFYRSGKKGLSFEDVFGEPLAPAKKRRTG